MGVNYVFHNYEGYVFHNEPIMTGHISFTQVFHAFSSRDVALLKCSTSQ